MIFVTVGTHTQGFERLVKEADELAGCGKINDDVVMQIGNTKYEPRNCKWFRFESFDNMIKWNKKARLVITHAGEGSIIHALQLGKPVIVVPRYKKFGEHTDDHQMDLAEMLEREKICSVVFEISKLGGAINEVFRPKIKRQRNERDVLIANLRRYISQI